jgi:hypothetical protein
MEESEFGQAIVDKSMELVSPLNPNSIKAHFKVDMKSQPDGMSLKARSFLLPVSISFMV